MGLMRKTLLLALLLTASLPSGAQSLPPGTPAIPHAAVPLQGLLSGGQPTPEHLEQAARAGYRTVINLRAPSEPGFAWEAEKVKALGMDYVALPVAGAADLTRENVERFDAALDAALAKGPVLLHCGSGNRDGALLALRAAWLDGMDPEKAIELGRAAGLTGLEPEVRALLIPPARP
jgi:uncharacterized protein (TIGR01244 family)